MGVGIGGYPGPNWSLHTHLGLDPREREVLRHIAGGMSNYQISVTMSYAEKTVINYVVSIYSKLDCTGPPGAMRVQAANWYNARKFDPIASS